MKIVRSKTRAEGGITPEERVAMEKISEEWIQIAFRTEPADPQEVEASIRQLYRVSKLPEPVNVVLVSSPLVMAVAAGAAAVAWETGIKPFSGRDQISVAIRAAMSEKHTPTVRPAAVPDPDLESSAFNILMEVAGDAGLDSAKNWWRMYQGGNMWASGEAHICAARDVLGLDLPEYKAYAAWERCARAGGFRMMHEKFCMVSDFPELIKVDDRSLPHCENGPSHRWRDGWELYYWHGTQVPKEWIMGKPDVSEALHHENVEMRRVAAEIVGWHVVLKELNAKTIDKHDNPLVGEVVEVDIPEVGRERFLRVQCGTRREFALPIPPTVKTAKEAQAWLHHEDEGDFELPAMRT